jgi:hypothetical protein
MSLLTYVSDIDSYHVGFYCTEVLRVYNPRLVSFPHVCMGVILIPNEYNLPGETIGYPAQPGLT